VIAFDRRSARHLTATFELRVRILRGRRGVPFVMRIDAERRRLHPGAPADPGAIAAIDAWDLVRLGLGLAAWPQLLSSGRLELSGDPFLALRLPTLFKLRAGSPSRGEPL
jgi:hypothetical protein